jgi:hypothetical protein
MGETLEQFITRYMKQLNDKIPIPKDDETLPPLEQNNAEPATLQENDDTGNDADIVYVN